MRALPRLLVLLIVALLAAPHVQAEEGQAEEGPRPLGRVAVRDDGFVRVTAERLKALGAPSAAGRACRRTGGARRAASSVWASSTVATSDATAGI
ncbi:MAG: hypothetical protein ABFS86_18105 [Planctomycetota bacterium]